MCTTRKIFQLTPSRRATPLGRKKCLELVISTHALTEGDIIQSGAGYSADYFNSRPHGGRQKRGQLAERCEIFQLTPSRRATFIMRHSINDLIISTHALTEGDRQSVDPGHLALISTHALTEGDVGCFYISFFSPISTHALTEGDFLRGCALIRRAISTHALTEGDSAGQCDLHLQQGISTHALTEGDTPCSATITRRSKFQLTPSRRATFQLAPKMVGLSISTHALTEGDFVNCIILQWSIKFQLTPSRRATANLDKFFF